MVWNVGDDRLMSCQGRATHHYEIPSTHLGFSR
jgi:hypothetical protein